VAAIRLYALAWFDVSQLCASTWNLGALYLLPELRTERFESFRLRRDELRWHYQTLAAEVVRESGPVEVVGVEALPFRLVETVTNIRSDKRDVPGATQLAIPAAALRILGWSGDIDTLRTGALQLLSECP
jgi:hypothetical protein